METPPFPYCSWLEIVIYLSKIISWIYFVLEQKPALFLLPPGVFYPAIQTVACKLLACIMLLQIKVINGLIWKLIQIRKRMSQNQDSTGHVNNVICLQSARSLLEDILNHCLLPLVFALGCPCCEGSESKGQRDSAGSTLPEDIYSSSVYPGWYFERWKLGFWCFKKKIRQDSAHTVD